MTRFDMGFRDFKDDLNFNSFNIKAIESPHKTMPMPNVKKPDPGDRNVPNSTLIDSKTISKDIIKKKMPLFISSLI